MQIVIMVMLENKIDLGICNKAFFFLANSMSFIIYF